MRKIVLLLLTFFTLQLGAAWAQSCEPAEDLPDGAIVFPLPYTEDNPMGGISDTAQINCPFEFTVTISTPPDFNGLPLEQISVAATGAIDNLPSGLTYLCNPPNCTFDADSTGCILLYGTPDETNATGAYPLVINGSLRLLGGTEIAIFYPGFPGLPEGSYDLHLNQGPPEVPCTSSAAEEQLRRSVTMESRPNPTTGYTQIQVSSIIGGEFDFIVTDLLGQVVHRQRVLIFEGDNTIEFDASQLPAGMYTYALRNQHGAVARQLVIGR